MAEEPLNYSQFNPLARFFSAKCIENGGVWFNVQPIEKHFITNRTGSVQNVLSTKCDKTANEL